LAVDGDIGDHALGARVEVETVVRHGLVIPDDLARLRPDREEARAVQAVQALPERGVVRLGVAGTDVVEIELRVAGAGLPRRGAALLPGLAHRRVGPGPRTLRAGGGDGVGAPQPLARLRIVAVEEAARRAFPPGHPRDQHAVDDDRRDHADIAFLVLGEL